MQGMSSRRRGTCLCGRFYWTKLHTTLFEKSRDIFGPYENNRKLSVAFLPSGNEETSFVGRATSKKNSAQRKSILEMTSKSQGRGYLKINFMPNADAHIKYQHSLVKSVDWGGSNFYAVTNKKTAHMTSTSEGERVSKNFMPNVESHTKYYFRVGAINIWSQNNYGALPCQE